LISCTRNGLFHQKRASAQWTVKPAAGQPKGRHCSREKVGRHGGHPSMQGLKIANRHLSLNGIAGEMAGFENRTNSGKSHRGQTFLCSGGSRGVIFWFLQMPGGFRKNEWREKSGAGGGG